MNENILVKNRAWIEIDAQNLKHNIKEIEGLMKKDCKIMAVVKANAYGHDMVKIATLLSKFGVDSFAVATIEEAILLRKNKIKGDVLILGYTDFSCLSLIKKYDLTQTVIDYNYAIKLNETLKCKINVQVKINTGMNRIGIKHDALDEIIEIFKLKHLNVAGVYTHLCCSDSLENDDVNYTRKQVERFNNCILKIKKKGFNPGKLHVQSSYGIVNYNELSYDYVRPGIIMYGVNENINMNLKNNVDLKPVLKLKAKVSSVKWIRKNEYVGYARKFKATSDMKLATISIGYADGYPRSLSNKNAKVLIKGKLCKVVGMICMDQIMVDVSRINNVKQGDVVELIGDKNEIRVEYLASLAGTISHEFLTNLGSRLKRIIK